jgi:hypothetical protein
MCTCTAYGTLQDEIITNTAGGRYRVEILVDEYADAPEWGGMAFFLSETRDSRGFEIGAGELPADVVATIRRAIRNRADVANGDQWAPLSGRALLRYLSLKGYPGAALVHTSGSWSNHGWYTEFDPFKGAGHRYPATGNNYDGVVIPDGEWGDAGKSANNYVNEFAAWANGGAVSVHIARVDEDGDTVEDMDSDYERYDDLNALMDEAREIVETYPGA